MESILKLQSLGEASEGTKWEFFFRDGLHLVRFFFNSKARKVDCRVIEFAQSEAMLAFINNQDSSFSSHRFLIYEMSDTESFVPAFKMTYLVSSSCRNLFEKIVEINKTPDTFCYLYEPLLVEEIQCFLKIAHAAGGWAHKPLSELLQLSEKCGGLLRNLFSGTEPSYSFQDVNETLVKLKECTPFNIPQEINKLVGIKCKYDVSLMSVKEDTDHSKLLAHYHDSKQWVVQFLSPKLALELGKHIQSQPEKLYHLPFVFELQEYANIYGGPLREPIENYSLPVGYYIQNWTFFECSHLSNNKFKGSLYDCNSLTDEAKQGLISILPKTSTIKVFRGQYLTESFHSLSTEYVYKSSVHNSPVFDCLTADPKEKRLFLFQSTTQDPWSHGCSIVQFNTVMNQLKLNPSEINEIYFYMLASSHTSSQLQHLFFFDISDIGLHCSYMSEYADNKVFLMGQVFMKKTESKSPNKRAMPTSKVDKLTNDEKLLLRSINGCHENFRYRKQSMNVSEFLLYANGRLEALRLIQSKKLKDFSPQDINLLQTFHIIKGDVKNPVAIDTDLLEDTLTSVESVLKIFEKKQTFELNEEEKTCFAYFQASINEKKTVTVNKFCPEAYFEVFLEDGHYQTLSKFLDYGEKLKPIICRAQFLNTPSINQ